jgi:hypothetical protein
MALLLMVTLLARMTAPSTNPILNERLHMFAPYKLFGCTVSHLVISANPFTKVVFCGFAAISQSWQFLLLTHLKLCVPLAKCNTALGQSMLSMLFDEAFKIGQYKFYTLLHHTSSSN